MSSRYLEFVIEQLSSLGEITSRAMFGGHCLYCHGVVFALVADDELYLKVDDVNRPEFEAAGLKPFRPFPDQDVVMQYYPAPAEMFDSEAGLARWAGGAIEAGRRKADRKRARKKAGGRAPSTRAQ